MFNFDEEKSDEIADWKQNQHLILDGTAHLEYPESEEIPRVKGLIELFNQLFRDSADLYALAYCLAGLPAEPAGGAAVPEPINRVNGL